MSTYNSVQPSLYTGFDTTLPEYVHVYHNVRTRPAYIYYIAHIYSEVSRDNTSKTVTVPGLYQHGCRKAHTRIVSAAYYRPVMSRDMHLRGRTDNLHCVPLKGGWGVVRQNPFSMLESLTGFLTRHIVCSKGAQESNLYVMEIDSHITQRK